MNQQKSNKQNLKAILLAVIGLAFIVLFFVLVTQSPTVYLLKPQISKEEILSQAESYFNQLIADPVEFKENGIIYLLTLNFNPSISLTSDLNCITPVYPKTTKKFMG